MMFTSQKIIESAQTKEFLWEKAFTELFMQMGKEKNQSFGIILMEVGSVIYT